MWKFWILISKIAILCIKYFSHFLSIFLVLMDGNTALDYQDGRGEILWRNSRGLEELAQWFHTCFQLSPGYFSSVCQLFSFSTLWLAHNLFHLVIVVVVGTHLSLWKLSKWQLLLLQCQQKHRLLSPLSFSSSLTLTQSLSLSLLVGQFFFYSTSLFMFLLLY